jgi:hypothetical protein
MKLGGEQLLVCSNRKDTFEGLCLEVEREGVYLVSFRVGSKVDVRRIDPPNGRADGRFGTPTGEGR